MMGSVGIVKLLKGLMTSGSVGMTKDTGRNYSNAAQDFQVLRFANSKSQKGECMGFPRSLRRSVYIKSKFSKGQHKNRVIFCLH